MLASEAMRAAATLLNDSSQSLWTHAVLLEPAKQAYEELCNDLIAHGFRVFSDVSTVLPVTAGATELIAQPANLLMPIKLEESDPGSNQWTPMTERHWEQSYKAGSNLSFWVWRENKLMFPPCDRDKDVKVFYRKNDLGILTGENSNIDLLNAVGLLGAKIASISAFHIAKNPEDGKMLEARYITRLNTYTKGELNNQQAMPGRRKPYRVRGVTLETNRPI